MSLSLSTHCLGTVATWSHEGVTVAPYPSPVHYPSSQSLGGGTPPLPHLIKETAPDAQEQHPSPLPHLPALTIKA